jgi:hypothetical protein
LLRGHRAAVKIDGAITVEQEETRWGLIWPPWRTR